MILLFSMVGIAAQEATVLFSDNYNRPDSTDIDASAVGTGGVLVPLVYVESFEGSGLATSIQIRNNQLNLAYGAGMSNLFLEHNFIDAAILEADGFSVSLDVLSIQTSDDTPNRFGGFGVGNSRAEAAAAGDSSNHAAPLRPTTGRANQGIGVSDFFVDVALDNNVRLWSKGSLLQTIPVGVSFGTIRADFYVTDFSAQSAVTVAVYFNGVHLSTREFTWDYTDTNYLALSARTPGEGVFVDNLNIVTFYEDKAHQPMPADGTIDVDPETVVLQWNKGKDAAGNPNADIARHFLYLTEGEPNFLDVLPIIVPDTADPVVYTPTSIKATDTDKTFYWRVDESVRINGTPTPPTDPNTIVGFVWSFNTVKAVPVITGQPVNLMIEPGQTATFTITVTSLSPVEYNWYKTTDNASNTPDDDLLVGQSEMLVIPNVQLVNEGYYYCKVNNASGIDAISSVVSLDIKRLTAWYAFENDLADSVDDNDGFPIKADPNFPFNYASGIVGQAIVLNGIDEAVEIPRSIQDSFTIALWVKTQAVGATGQWYLGRGLVDGEAGGVTNDFGTVLLGSKFGFGVGNPDTTISSQTNINDNQWYYCVAARDHLTGQMQLYVNGILEATATGGTGRRDIAPELNIGRIRTAGISTYLAGQIDEVKLFNYAKDPYGVADMYYDITEIPLCLNPDSLDMRFDVAGGGPAGSQPDCKINLNDFAVFAGNWLNCGLYPQEECD